MTARLIRNPKRLQQHVFCDGFEGLAPSSVALQLQRNGAMEQGVRRQFFQNQAPGFSFWRPVRSLSLCAPGSARSCMCMPSWRFPLDTQRGSEKFLCNAVMSVVCKVRESYKLLTETDEAVFGMWDAWSTRVWIAEGS